VPPVAARKFDGSLQISYHAVFTIVKLGQRVCTAPHLFFVPPSLAKTHPSRQVIVTLAESRF